MSIVSVIFNLNKNKLSKNLMSAIFCVLSINFSAVTTYCEGEIFSEDSKYVSNISIDDKIETKKEELSSNNISENKNENASEGVFVGAKNVEKTLKNEKKVSKVKNDKVKTGSKKEKSPKIEKSKLEEVKREKNIEKPKPQKIEKKNTNKIFHNGRKYNVIKTISGTATAYSDHGETSTGCMVCRGVIAVNPKDIPYGSHLLLELSNGTFVEGYALDTGGALRSRYKNVVADIYMETETECRKFGRKGVKVHIIN